MLKLLMMLQEILSHKVLIHLVPSYITYLGIFFSKDVTNLPDLRLYRLTIQFPSRHEGGASP